jgi:hypothetical protein
MSKITKSAKGEECQIRIPGTCNFNPETTVFCHLGGAGMGRKSVDLHGSYGCSSCHDVIDSRVRTTFTPDEIKVMFFDGMVRTQMMLLDKELVTI